MEQGGEYGDEPSREEADIVERESDQGLDWD
jgi:hypothetical protein